jgi:tRNA1Val (adenine37-N6)-methyltransferase
MLPVPEESTSDMESDQNMTSLKGQTETVDGVLGGRLKIIQKEKGYRFSIDAYLLAHFVCMNKNDRVLDMGTGSGVIPIIVAHRYSCDKVVGIDIQEEMVDMARRSVALNGLDNKIDIMLGDIRTIEILFDHQSFDVVIINPPYRKRGSGRINPDYQKSVARHEITGCLSDFLTASRYVLKESGRVCIIYPASRLVELIFQMRLASIEPKRLQMVHSNDCSQGVFILVEGIKGGREEIEILPPLCIYGANGAYSEVMTWLFRELSEFH